MPPHLRALDEKPDEALLFGTPGYLPSYDPNQENSAVNAYNTRLAQFTPDELLRRYAQTDRNFNNGTWDANYSNAYRSFKSQIGRDPTASEFAQLIPAFQQGTTYGNAIIGSIRDRLAQNPNDPMNQGRAGQYGGQIRQVFKSMLGRDATPEEVNHFGSLMSTGNVNAYQLQDFLRGTPEYQTQEDTKFRGGLTKELENADISFFDRAKQGLQAQYMRQGTNMSSAMDSALTDLMGQIAEKRSQYLAGLSSQQYGGNKDLALQNYRGTQDRYLNEQNYNRGMSNSQNDYFRGRGDDLYDYQRQMDDMARMQNSRDRSGRVLRTGDWINLGLGVGNTAAQAYMAGQGGGAFSHLGNRGYQPYSGGAQGPYAYGR